MLIIGSQIERILREKRLPITKFAKKINTNRNNVYNIFTRKTIDTGLLEKISEVLEFDFFKFYNDNEFDFSLKNKENEESLKIDDTLKVENKNLKKEIEILKKEINLKDKIIALLENK